jgi:hypothetical protein
MARNSEELGIHLVTLYKWGFLKNTRERIRDLAVVDAR